MHADTGVRRRNQGNEERFAQVDAERLAQDVRIAVGWS